MANFATCQVMTHHAFLSIITVAVADVELIHNAATTAFIAMVLNFVIPIISLQFLALLQQSY